VNGIKGADHLIPVTEHIVDRHSAAGFLSSPTNDHTKLFLHPRLEIVPPVPSKWLIKVCSAFVNIMCKVTQFLQRGTVAAILAFHDLCKNWHRL
jgi:TorA maturation chaperone TorD